MAKKKKINKARLYRYISDGKYGVNGSSGFCPKDWHRLTGIRLRKGQTKQVKITHLKKGFKFELI